MNKSIKEEEIYKKTFTPQGPPGKETPNPDVPKSKPIQPPKSNPGEKK